LKQSGGYGLGLNLFQQRSPKEIIMLFEDFLGSLPNLTKPIKSQIFKED